MNEKLLIAGTGSQAKYVIDILNENIKNGSSKKKNIIAGFVDIENNSKNAFSLLDDTSGERTVCCMDEVSSLFDAEMVDLVVVHGDCRLKEKTVECFISMCSGKKDFPSLFDEYYYFNSFRKLISNSVYVSEYAKVGDGTVINANASVMPDADIGEHIIIHSNATVEHDNIIEDYVNIAPGVSLAGNVKVGRRSYVYTGANVAPNVTIGRDCVIGAGSTVLNDIPPGTVAVGTPAKVIKERPIYE